MNIERRAFLETIGHAGAFTLLAVCGVKVSATAADNRAAFESRSVLEAFRALGFAPPKKSKAIEFRLPEIAENGAVVPLEITSKLPHTRAIAILIEKNPRVLSANFSIPNGTEPLVATRVKVAETSNIHAVVRTDAGIFYATRAVKVTVGGCGG